MISVAEFESNKFFWLLNFSSEILLFKRSDVSEVMQCHEQYCSGFLVALNNTSKKLVNVKWGEATASVDLDSVAFTTQLLEIDALPKECMDAATTLLEHNGFFWGQKSTEDIDTP